MNKNEPDLPKNAPICPNWLKKEAKNEWFQVCELLAKAGVITRVDKAVLAAYCQSYARAVELERQIKKIADYTDETPSGYKQQAALVGVLNKTWDRTIKLAAELGLTPSSRSRIHADGLSQTGASEQDQKDQAMFG
ncbi:MAG TPA: phage terminase small subunit P27 family [Chroococcales cyanobacterium]